MLTSLLALGMAFAALWGLARGLLGAPCWALVFLVALVAWPIWVSLREYALFLHRVTLYVAATEETSRLRRWFWRGALAGGYPDLLPLFSGPRCCSPSPRSSKAGTSPCWPST